MAVEWTEELLTGISDIDNQHKELLRRLKDLRTACHEGRGKDFYKTGERLYTTLEMNELIGSWWISHISSIDKVFGRYLKDKIKKGGDLQFKYVL